MQYEPLERIPLHRIFSGIPDILPGERVDHANSRFSWDHDTGCDEILSCDGRPVARVLRRGGRWLWQAVGTAGPELRTGSRAEARQLAVFFARRTCGAQPAPGRC